MIINEKMLIRIFIILIIIIIIIIIISLYNILFINNQIDYSIKKIIPEYNINTDAEIIFVYVYTPNIYSYAKHSIKNLLTYANKYNYGVIIYNNVFNNNVSPCWNKIAAILENLSKHKYLVWFDADAIISNFNIKIESLIDKMSSIDLYLCFDISLEKECINSGVMIIKNTEWSLNLFTRVWYSHFVHGHNDQNVIFYEIVKDLYPNSEPNLKYSNFCNKILHPKVKFLSENTFNTNILNYNSGDFIIHLMGESLRVRINIMRQINTKLGLDNYNNKECVDLLESSNNNNRYELIKNKCLINQIILS